MQRERERRREREGEGILRPCRFYITYKKVYSSIMELCVCAFSSLLVLKWMMLILPQVKYCCSFFQACLESAHTHAHMAKMIQVLTAYITWRCKRYKRQCFKQLLLKSEPKKGGIELKGLIAHGP